MASGPVNEKSIDVLEVLQDLELSFVRTLFAEYAQTLDGGAHMSLHHQGFERELATLPGRYSRPSGCILLARVEGVAAGCIALREIGAAGADAGRVCEMKRMYVQPEYRGMGLGRRLAERLIAEATSIGYSMMKLDTEPEFAAALGLYRSLGFEAIPRYNDDPVACTMYLGRRLA